MLLEAFINFQRQEKNKNKKITPCGYMKSRPFAASLRNVSVFSHM